MNVIDQIFGKAKEVAEIASKKTGEVVEVSKLKMNSVQITNEVEECYQKLGSAVYTMVKSSYENPDLINSIIEEIDELLGKINDNAAKISELRNIVTCECCGHKSSIEACFCAKCGNRLIIVKPAQPAEPEESTEPAEESSSVDDDVDATTASDDDATTADDSVDETEPLSDFNVIDDEGEDDSL